MKQSNRTLWTNAFRTGWDTFRKNPQLIGAWYLLFFVLSLAGMFPIYHWVERALAHSPEWDKLLPGPDHTVLFDLLNNYYEGGILTTLGLVAILQWFLLNFLAGGVIKSWQIEGQRTPLAATLAYGWRYWGRMLRLNTWYLAAQGIWLLVIGLGFWWLTDGLAVRPGQHEGLLLRYFFIACCIWIIPALYLALVLDLSRIRIVREDSIWLLRPMGKSLKSAFFQILPYSVWFLSFLLAGLALAFLQIILLPKPSGAQSGFLLITFFWTQLFLIFRIGIRMLRWSVGSALFRMLEKNPEAHDHH